MQKYNEETSTEEQSESSDVEEEYIDPEDLSIIENPDKWKPTKDQLNGYIKQLKFELDYKPEEVKKIALKYLTSSLPLNMKRAFFKHNHEVLYIDNETSEIHLTSDIEEKAKEEYKKLRAEKYSLELKNNNMNRVNNNIEKIQEIIKEYKEDNLSKKKKDDLFDYDFDNKDYLNKNNDLYDYNFEENEDNNYTHQSKNKNIDLYEDKNLNKKKNNDLSDSDDGSFDVNNISGYKKDEIYNFDIDVLGNDNIEKNVNKKDNENLNKLKKFYVEKAKSELNIYKEVLKRKYIKEKKEYYINKEDDIDKKININTKKSNNQIEDFNKDELDKFEEELYDKNEIELDKYEKELKADFQNKFNKNQNKNEDNNYQLNILELKKQSLNSQIKLLKQKNENLKNQNMRKIKELINQNNILTNDKKRNLENKLKLEIEEIENNFKINFEQYKKEVESVIKLENLRKKEENINNSENNIKTILKDYQKILDDNLEIKKNIAKKDMEEKKNIELEDYKKKYQKDTQNQINFIQNQQYNLEKEFNEQLEELRIKNRNDIELNNQLFYNTLKNNGFNIDIIKNKTSDNLKICVDNIIEHIKNLFKNNKIENEEVIKDLEKQLESYIFEYLSNEKIQFYNKKSPFDISQQEYKSNKLKLNYFCDLLNYIVKIIIDNPLTNIDIGEKKNEEMKLNTIQQYGNDIINEYRSKYLNEMSQKLYPSLEMEILKLEGVINNKRDFGINLTKDNINNKENQTSITLNLLNNENDTQNMFNSNFNMQINQPSFILPKNNSNYLMENTLRSNNNNNDSIRTNKQNEFRLHSNNYNKPEDLRYYNDNNNLINDNINVGIENKQFKSDLFDINQNNNLIKEQIPNLPKEIVESLNENDFKLYSEIMDFLYDESTYLIKEIYNLESERNANEQLSQINERGHLLHLSKIFDNEKIKTLQNEQVLNNKFNTFNLIKNHTQEIFKFISNNPNRTSVINNKLNLIIQHIFDYNKAFKNLNVNNPNVNTYINLFNNNVLPSQNETKDLKIDTGIRLSLKNDKNKTSRPNYINSLMKNHETEDRFKYFYRGYSPKILDSKINSTYTHTFFNTKKNNDLLSFRINTSINPNNYSERMKIFGSTFKY